MKYTLALILAAGCLAGSLSIGSNVTAEGLGPKQSEFKVKTLPQKPGAKPTHSGGEPMKIQAIPAVLISCLPGYNKVGEHKTDGAVDTMTCQSPVYECPHKSKIKRNGTAAANGQKIEIRKIPVGAGDSNRFKFEYTCTYYWNMG